MAKYLDICLQPVPKKHLAQYRKGTKAVGKLLLKYGALASRDYVADDKNAVTAFAKKITVKPSEVLVYAEAEFKSKSHRDQVFKKMFKDPTMQKMMNEPSNFMDQSRAVMGGFKLLVAVEK